MSAPCWPTHRRGSGETAWAVLQMIPVLRPEERHEPCCVAACNAVATGQRRQRVNALGDWKDWGRVTRKGARQEHGLRMVHDSARPPYELRQ